jgi:hypothetical protein
VAATRRERFDEMLRRLNNAAPFADCGQARAALEEIMRAVEDELSEIPEDPNAHLATMSDGRMYPPHDRYEIRSASPRIRAFRQKGHKTYFGDNGALLIERLNGEIEINLSGANGETIDDLRLEKRSEPN